MTPNSCPRPPTRADRGPRTRSEPDVDAIMDFLRKRQESFKFADKVTWGQLSKKGNLKFAKKAVVTDFTFDVQVGVCIWTESPVEHVQVDVDQIVKGWGSKEKVKRELFRIEREMDSMVLGEEEN